MAMITTATGNPSQPMANPRANPAFPTGRQSGYYGGGPGKVQRRRRIADDCRCVHPNRDGTLMTTAARILGIDPGLNVTGYAVLEAGERGPRVLEAGVVRGA